MLNSSRSTRLSRIVLLCGGLTVVVGTLAFAKAPWAFQAKPAAAQLGTVRSTLNFPLGSRWDKVLNGFASEHGLTLVMDRIPSGTFKRFDRRKHALTASLNILNEDLAQQDFRLLLQQDFLVLLHLRETRTRYRRPHLPVTTRAIATPTQSLPIPVAGPGFQSESHTIRPRSWQPPQPLHPTPADTGQPIQRVQLENPIESKLIRTPLVPKHRTALT